MRLPSLLLASCTLLPLAAAESFPGDTGEAFVMHWSPRTDSPFPAMAKVQRLHLTGDGHGVLTLVIDAKSPDEAAQLEALWPTAQEKAKRTAVRDALAAASFSRSGDRITISGTVPADLREQLIKRIAGGRNDG